MLKLALINDSDLTLELLVTRTICTARVSHTSMRAWVELAQLIIPRVYTCKSVQLP